MNEQRISALTQAERVLRLARLRGEHGFTQIDFDLPGVTDGGTPIKRVAARVLELREQGYGIDSGERRQLCTVYRLTADVEAPAAPVSEVVEQPPSQAGGDLDAGRLFDLEAA